MTTFSETLFPAIEVALKAQVAHLDEPQTAAYHEMLTYHMGWTGEGAGPTTTGKRIRPLMVLLAASASGGDWRTALPAAAAVELVHNFSLLHDDIQDNSATRRGRPAVWVRWGVAQAINAGDGLFILANQAMTTLKQSHSAEIVLQATQILQETCLNLTRGQHLDIGYAVRSDLQIEDYWPMISGKTAALLSACMQIGSLLGSADADTQLAYRDFGHYLGLAFQVQDDILGIWGDETQTGKSVASDLLEGKKSLPVLYGLANTGKFAARWAQGPLNAEDVPKMAHLLESEGARLQAQQAADQMTALALNSLRMAAPQGEAGLELYALAKRLLGREA
ncbi:MAG: polyprenyl synthetase family protein [Anaerolineales bacterium]|nr:polyprenyl synthetase family protein [Anaerolineales bacterium]